MTNKELLIERINIDFGDEYIEITNDLIEFYMEAFDLEKEEVRDELERFNKYN